MKLRAAAITWKLENKKFCIDIGMEQGQDMFENQEIPVNPSELDFILLTHAHIDHTGLTTDAVCQGIPRTGVRNKGDSRISARLCLRDSAHIQQFEAEWRNRKAQTIRRRDV